MKYLARPELQIFDRRTLTTGISPFGPRAACSRAANIKAGIGINCDENLIDRAKNLPAGQLANLI
jgi:hypothetical protein